MGLTKTNVQTIPTHCSSGYTGELGGRVLEDEKVVQSWKRKLLSSSLCLFIGAFLKRVK